MVLITTLGMGVVIGVTMRDNYESPGGDSGFSGGNDDQIDHCLNPTDFEFFLSDTLSDLQLYVQCFYT